MTTGADTVGNIGAALVLIGIAWAAIAQLTVVGDGWPGLAPGILVASIGIVLIAYGDASTDDDDAEPDGGTTVTVDPDAPVDARRHQVFPCPSCNDPCHISWTECPRCGQQFDEVNDE